MRCSLCFFAFPFLNCVPFKASYPGTLSKSAFFFFSHFVLQSLHNIRKANNHFVSESISMTFSSEKQKHHLWDYKY